MQQAPSIRLAPVEVAMNRSAPHLSDQVLTRGLVTAIVQESNATAMVLDHVAEFDARRLYRAAGYSSMFAYCVEKLHRSEDATYKRIQAARAANRFPAIFDMVADGRLHLSAVCLLAPHLTEDTAGELLAAATHKSKAQIEQLLAERFPRPDMPTRVQALPVVPLPEPAELAPGQVGMQDLPLASSPMGNELELAPGQVQVPLVLAPEEDRARVKPLAPQRFALQVTIDQETHDALCYAQELLSHELPSGDVAQVLAMALKALIPQLEKRKFAATSQPRPRRRSSSPNPRYIPPDVQRAVWKRDQGQCTFVSDDGHRCEARKFVEFDHVQEVARGGEASIDRLRLRCRAHNQYQAECTFGAEFMRHKRIAAAEARAAAGGRTIG
jgi:5-methylcytosine-specific restriction endonuclease McrA